MVITCVRAWCQFCIGHSMGEHTTLHILFVLMCLYVRRVHHMHAIGG